MEFKQLQSFAVVVKYQSFTKAAELLFTSQPTISAHIRQLEEELHYRLITRTTKKIEVTPRGLELYEFAEHILGLRDEFVTRWTIEQNENVIRMGTSTLPSGYILPELLPAYRKAHPDIRFDIHQRNSDEIIDAILHGSIELGIVGIRTPAEGVTFLPFYQDSMVIVTPATPKFLELRAHPIPPRELLMQEPLLLRERSGGSKKYIETYFEQIHLNEDDLHVTARINDQESIKQLVASGLGISIISRKAAQNMEQSGQLLTFELPNQKNVRTLYLIYRTDFILKNSTRQFIAFVRDFYPDFPDKTCK